MAKKREELIKILLDYRAKIITKQKYNLEDYLKAIEEGERWKLKTQ